jgi:cell wall-associated NlpC family hydrolase
VSSTDLALASVKSVDSLSIAGRGLSADLRDAITAASTTLTTEGASTLEIGIRDPRRAVLDSGILGAGMLLRLDGFPFELAAVSKQGSNVTLTFEHEVVAALRRHKKPLKVKAGSMSHVQFARRLVHEEPWLQFVTGGKAVKANNALTRGQPGQPETSWDALGRNGGDRGFRVFARGYSEVWYVSDAYLVSRPTFATLTPGSDGVDDIDFSYDEGQPVAEATVTAEAGRWTVPPGEHVAVAGCGPANGTGWLVASIARDIFKTQVAITLHKPAPRLPEPKKDASGSAGGGSKASSSSGPGVSGLGTSASDFVNKALGERGRPYVWGADGSTSFDCSGLVEWTLKQLGIPFPRTSGEQYERIRREGLLISVEQAEHVKGALLFMGIGGTHHVAISLGDGRTIEARGKAYGVNVFNATGRSWSAAGIIPGLVYSQSYTPLVQATSHGRAVVG